MRLTRSLARIAVLTVLLLLVPLGWSVAATPGGDAVPLELEQLVDLVGAHVNTLPDHLEMGAQAGVAPSLEPSGLVDWLPAAPVLRTTHPTRLGSVAAGGAPVEAPPAASQDGTRLSISPRAAGGLPLGGIELLLPILMGMVALTKDRDTPGRDGRLIDYPVAAAAKIFAGSLVVLDGGYAKPGTTALNLIAIGRANETVDNSAGANGDDSVLVERGVFRFANDGSITQANVGADAFIVDDQTVAATNGAGTRSVAGKIRGVETGGVWVEI